ncbi:MAG TPA: NADH-quinone oxidoreductase subunit C [Candidatus Dormibacteraeota bacterium]
MSTTWEMLAGEQGLRVDWPQADEAVAECEPGQFSVLVAALATQATLADLFVARAPGIPARLVAVLQAPKDATWLLLSCEVGGSGFPSLTPQLHGASWYEREIYELHGLEPIGHPALAPQRIHLGEEVRHHGGRAPGQTGGPVRRRPAVTGQGVFQLPLGPVRSGPQEAAAFFFSSGGEDIVDVDLRLGFKHRAIEVLAEGRRADQVIQLAERLAGTSAFANGLAYTRAVERVLGAEVDEVAEHTRALFGELERFYNHVGTIGRLAEATGLLVAAAQYGLIKEEALREAGRLSGHRYLRGVIKVGGVELVPAPGTRQQLRADVASWAPRTEQLRRLLEQTSTFIDRLDTTAVLTPEYAMEHGLVGPVGRASGVARDVRRDHPYAAYPKVRFEVPSLLDGDAEARFEVVTSELAQSIMLMSQLLDGWPTAGGGVDAPHWRPGAALGWAEAPGGEALHWVNLDEAGRIVQWRARPPAVVNWHAFAQACGSGNNLTDFPVIEASFAISPAEFDR